MKNVGMLVKTSIIYNYCERKIGMEKRNFKNICEGDLVLWMPKSTKIKGGKFKLPWKGPIKCIIFLIITLSN